MIAWISLKESPPDPGQLCWVSNNQAIMSIVEAFYVEGRFVLYHPDIRLTLLLDVTHYIPCPPYPDMTINEKGKV